MSTQTSITFDDEELSTVAFEAVGEARSTHHRPYPVAKWLIDNHANQSGGEKLGIKWKVRDHSTTQKLSGNGANPIALNFQPVYDIGHDSFFYVAAPTMVSMVDKAQTGGRQGIMDRVRDRAMTVDEAQHRDLELAFLIGQVAAGAAWSDVRTLNGDLYTNGILENAAPGAQTNTLHNQSRTTYQSLAFWQNFYVNLQNSFSMYGTDLTQQLVVQMRNLVPRTGGLRGFCTENYATFLSRALQSNEQYVPGDKRVGTVYMGYAGIEFETVAPGHLPTAAQTTGGLPWSAVILDAEYVKLVALSNMLMHRTGFKDAGGGYVDVKIDFQVIMAQIRCTLLGVHALIVNGETW